MSVGAIGGALPLPPGSEKRTDAERAALGFERMLLVQLTQQMAKTAEGEESTSAARSWPARWRCRTSTCPPSSPT